MHGRHVNEEAAGKRDVTRDARAFFAERLFGDLDDDILTGLEHFRNQLGTARWARALEAVVAMMSTATTWATTLEASPGTATAMIATSTITAAVSTSVATTIVASTTIATTTAIRALESRTRVTTANASGVSRSKIFAWCTCGTRRACLAGQQDRIVRVRVSGGFAGSRDGFGLEFAFVMIDGVAVLVLF